MAPCLYLPLCGRFSPETKSLEARSFVSSSENVCFNADLIIMASDAHADHENGMRVPRSSSRKRPSVAESPELLKSKKRVMLGELTNSLDLDVTWDSLTPEVKLNKENSLSATGSTPNLGFQTRSCKRNLMGNKNQDLPEEINKRSRDLQKYAFSSIYEHLHSLEMEENRRPSPNYMEEVQNDVMVNMREILVDWLVEVAEEYKLVSDTLYLAVTYIDRFLSSHALRRNRLQLLGVSCMLIASKHEEISPLHVEDFCYVTDNTYTTEEVMDMKKDVLKFLNYEIGTPTTKNFLRLLTKAAQVNCKFLNLQFEFLCCYLAELSLLDYACLRFLPSMVAASAVFLSRFIIQPDMLPWSMALQCYSGYMPLDLKECVLIIHDLQLNRGRSSLYAIRDKYMQHKFKSVAKLSPPSEIPARYFEAISESRSSEVSTGCN